MPEVVLQSDKHYRDIYTSAYPCEGEKVIDVPLVLLHGWGFDSGIWNELLTLLKPHFDVITLDLPGFGRSESAGVDVTSILEELRVILPEHSILLGWSLGGMLATAFAQRYPQRVTALVTVGSNLKWLATDGWSGMDAESFAQFQQSIQQQADVTRKRFCGLIAKGDEQEKQQTRSLRDKLSAVSVENLLQGLELLSCIDNRAGFAQLSTPGLHIFGENDRLVPAAAVAEITRIARFNKVHKDCQEVAVYKGIAHAPFLSAPQRFVNQLVEFVERLPYRIDKKRVARSFSRAARTYDAAADLQRQVGDCLLSKLPDVLPNNTARVLDLGCGTGYYYQTLQQRFPQAAVFGLDIASGMLQVAQHNNPGFNGLCADAENLPLADNSIDVLFSSLAIQWCQHLPALFGEIQRVLVPGGVAVVSTFQQGTLKELKRAWQAVDSCAHVNYFVTEAILKEQAQAEGFALVTSETQTVVRDYAQVRDLTRELKAIGAHNINTGQSEGLTSKGKLRSFTAAYEKQRNKRGLPAHYEVVYLVLRN